MSNQATPLTLNNGIFLQTRQYDYGMHLDTAHLRHLRGGMDKPDHLGMITPWIMTGYLMKPGMYEITGMGKNRKLLNSHLFEWEVPIGEQDVLVVADLSNTATPGIDGQSFKFKTNRRKFGHTDIITADKYSQLAAYITSDEITQDGDGWVYTARLFAPNARGKWFPKEFLRPGARLFKIGSVMGEYSQTYSDTEFTGGVRKFYNHIGSTGTANTHFTVTRDAAFSKISQSAKLNIDQYRKMVEIYQFRPGSPGYDVSLQGKNPISQIYQKPGMSYKDALKTAQDDIVFYSWVPAVEALGMALVEADIENMAMWSPGGTIEVEGKTKVELPVGLYHQLNNGHVRTYNIGTMSIKKFELYIMDLLRDRMEPYSGHELTILTGQGGLRQMKDLLRRLPSQNGMIVIANEFIGNKGGDNLDLHFAAEFISWEFAFGKVKFQLAPALDPPQASDLENPVINGFRLSSYMYIITDITGGMDNVHELLYGPDYDFNCRFINGRMNYLDSSSYAAYPSANNGPGFSWYCEKRHKAYWIADPTKTLLVKPVNPQTGRIFGESYFE